MKTFFSTKTHNTKSFILSALLVIFSYQSLWGATTTSLHVINDWIQTNADICNESYLFAQSDEVPLFKTFPHLKNEIPYLEFLENFPTPVNHLTILGKALGHNHIYLKNDSSSGNLMGGNKLRKLPFLLGWALRNKADLIVTCGGAGSNHSVATIDCAKQIGLPCFSFLSEQKPTSYTRRNLLLSKQQGGHLFLFPDMKGRAEGILRFTQECKGLKVFYIPAGGSNGRGSLGFVNAAFELAQQVKDGLVKKPDVIFIAVGSNGSAAGLSLGLALAGLKSQVIGICTTSMTPEALTEDCKNLHTEMLEILKLSPPQNILLPIYDDSYFGPGYAAITPKTATASKLLLETENITLDVTYAGKAFGAVYDFALEEKNKNKVILFWDTFCSSSLTEKTKTVDYRDLPKEFHHYFTDVLQTGDLGLV